MNRSGLDIAAVIAVMALLAAACGSSGGVAEVTLAQLTTDQDRYDEQLVRTEGIVRALDDPRHFWIEDADLHRVELQPPGSVESHLGERIRVQGRFTFRDDEGRRITVDDVEVLDAAPEVDQVAATGGSYTRAAPGALAPLLDAPDTLVINFGSPSPVSPATSMGPLVGGVRHEDGTTSPRGPDGTQTVQPVADR